MSAFTVLLRSPQAAGVLHAVLTADDPAAVLEIATIREAVERVAEDVRALARVPAAAAAEPGVNPDRRRASPRRPSAAGLLSARATAARLGIGRDTLGRLVDAEVIRPVPKGARLGFRAVDVERLVETGYRLPDAPPPPPPAKRKRRQPNGPDAAAIAAELAKF